jgi:hypothetical protein
MPVIRVITALNYNKQGHVQYVRWGLADTDTNCWKVAPEQSHVIHVLEALKYGEEVWTVIIDGERVLPGPRVHAVKLRPGLKTIAMLPADGEVADAAMSLARLPVF